MTYGTDNEKKAIEIIKKHHPNCEIINPNTPEYQNECARRISTNKNFKPGDEIGYFHKLADDADIGCFLQYYDGKWSAGSASELNYLKGKGKQTYKINLEEESLEEIDKIEAMSFQETLDKLYEAGLRHYR